MSAIFILLTFVLFIIANVIVRKIKTKKANKKSINSGTNIPFSLKVEDLVLPTGLFFHPGHTWAKIDVSGKIKVGLDDFAQKIFGKIDGIKLRKVGDTINRGERIFTVKQGKRQAAFNSPVDGIITSINEEVTNDPSVLKDNPYEKGWIYSIKPTNLATNIKSLSVAEDAMNWLKNEVRRFDKFISENFVRDKKLGKTMADGGIPVEGVVEHMDDLSWFKLQEKFLAK